MAVNAVSMDQAVANWKKRLENLAKNGLRHIINHANAIIELEAPSYLGVYRDAVFLDDSEFPKSLSLTMTIASLTVSAQAHAGDIAEWGYDIETYVYGEAIPNKVVDADGVFTLQGGIFAEPYPLRIEAIGSPKADEGQDAWLHAQEAARQSMQGALRMATL